MDDPVSIIFGAFQSQMGLKLEAEKDVVDLLVIDSANRVPPRIEETGFRLRGILRLMKSPGIALMLTASSLVAQTFTPQNPAALAARQWRNIHESAIIGEFAALLAIPDISSDRANIQRNAETIASMMQRRGIASRLVTIPGANPVVFGEVKTPGAKRTIVFYAHYDGQPLDPKRVGNATILTDTPRQATGKRRASYSIAWSRRCGRSRMATVRAERGGRQSADHCPAHRDGCDTRRWPENKLEY